LPVAIGRGCAVIRRRCRRRLYLLGNVRTPLAMPASPLKILSVIPPMTQLNTPYPSTA
jgi:hypothetical protein